MQKTDNTLDLHVNSLARRICRQYADYQYVILSTMIVGLLCYTFAFTNKLLNHDEAYSLFQLGSTVSSGRWGIQLIEDIFPVCSMPWLNGVATLALLAVSNCLIVRIFEIRQPLLQVLLCSLIIAFPSLMETFGFMFTSVCYGISFLLAVLSVYLITCRKPVWTLPAVLLFALSLGIYQAYLAIAASLLVIYLIRDTLYSDIPIKTVFRKGLCFVAFLLVSLLLYWGIAQLFLRLSGSGFNAYSQATMQTGRSIPARLYDCYYIFACVFLFRVQSLFTPVFSQGLHLICGLLIGIEILFRCLNRDRHRRIPMLLFLLAVYPLAVTSILLVVDISSIRPRVLYGFATVYVLAAVILENGSHIFSSRQLTSKLRAGLMDVTQICMALVICSNIFLANEAYMQMYLNNSQNLSFAASLTAQIHSMPEYEEDTPVAIIGQYPAETHPEFQVLAGFEGLSGQHVYDESYQDFLKDYAGADLNLVSYEELESIADTPEFRNMPTYPDHGYVQMISGTVVVKMPE